MADPDAGNRDVVAAMFETGDEAHAARDALIAGGIAQSAIEVVCAGAAARPTDSDSGQGIWATLRGWFARHEHAHDYAEGVGRGHAMVFVRGSASEQSTSMAILETLHPVDMMNRVRDWKDAGWNGVHASSARAPPTSTGPESEVESAPADVGAEPDHVSSTGLLHDEDTVRPIGAPLVNPMGIQVPNIRTTGNEKVRRYEYDPDALPVDDV